jgi:hypothetical protein
MVEDFARKERHMLHKDTIEKTQRCTELKVGAPL